MNPRSRFPLRTALFLMLGGGLLAPVFVSCAPPDGATVIPEAVAGCEYSAGQVATTNEIMLPGSNCAACHKAGGQAANSPWTLSGTVFTKKNSPCGPGGLSSIFVEIRDGKGVPQPNGTLRTNGVGNFWSAERFTSPIQARIYQLDPKDPQKVIHENCMILQVGITQSGSVPVNCETCHQQPPTQGAPGRLYLDDSNGQNPCNPALQPPAM